MCAHFNDIYFFVKKEQINWCLGLEWFLDLALEIVLEILRTRRVQIIYRLNFAFD